MKLLHEFVFAGPDVGDIVAATDMVFNVYFVVETLNFQINIWKPIKDVQKKI